MKPLNLFVARFPGNNSEHPASSEWTMQTVLRAKDDPRISGCVSWYKSDTPIDMVRNLCIEKAKEAEADFILMVDSDMSPDYHGGDFFGRALDFIEKKYDEHPVIIAAPYCGPPPHENIYVFDWGTFETEDGRTSPHNLRLKQVDREDAARRSGIHPAAALPTGVILIDMRVFTGFQVGENNLKLPYPYFAYEWSDHRHIEKASTEDVFFTRNASLLFGSAGLGCCYCDWSSWGAHIKLKYVPAPTYLGPEMVGKELAEALVRPSMRERLVHVNP